MLIVKLEGIHHGGDLGIDWMIILKLILGNWVVKVVIELLHDGFQWWALLNTVIKKFRFFKTQGMS